MTDDPVGSPNRPSPDRNFLFYSTGEKHPEIPAKGPSRVPEGTCGKDPVAFGDASFLQDAVQRLEFLPRFAALAIRMDESSSGDPEERDTDAALGARRAMERICEKKNGGTGEIEEGLFACFFPDTSASGAEKIARAIRKKIAGSPSGSVSIGIATYPLLHFTRRQTFENARKALVHAGFFGPGSIVSFDAVSLNISGDACYQSGDIPGAVREFQDGLRLDPLNVNLHNSLGVCYGVLGEPEKAMEAFEAVRWLDPEEAMAPYNIGMILRLKNDRSGALERFLEAEGINGEIFEISFQIGRLQLEMGHPGKAKAFLEKAVRLRPDSGAAWRLLGDCLGSLDLTREAAAAYQKAVRYSPNDAAALSSLGYLLDLLGENPDITQVFCRQSVEIAPENGLFRRRLGAVYLKQNRLEEAMKEFEAADVLGCDTTDLMEKVQDKLVLETQDAKSECGHFKVSP